MATNLANFNFAQLLYNYNSLFPHLTEIVFESNTSCLSFSDKVYVLLNELKRRKRIRER